MIGRLAGRIVEESLDGSVVIDVGGVGYELTVPIGTLGRVTPDPAGNVTLFVHTHLREDALLLYGFASADDRSAFRHLISVSNVGPRIAINLLGVLSVVELSTAIARGESAKLTKVPGVGKKTAERIVLELKDKLLAPPSVAATPLAAARPTAKSSQGELLQSALTRMGFRPAEAERAITALGDRVETTPLGELVREALTILAK